MIVGLRRLKRHLVSGLSAEPLWSAGGCACPQGARGLAGSS
jgi:hypothetical protein